MTELQCRLTALEAEVARQRDHIEIRQLIASYGPMVDTATGLDRSEKLAELWVEDGVYDIGGVGAKHGRADIARAFEDQHFGMVPNGVCHVMGLPYVHVDGDRASALNYSCVFRPDGERFYAWRVSANRWDFVRVDGRWRIDTRTNKLMSGEDEVLAMLRGIDAMVEDADRS
jgi:hypothetical protein